MKKAVMGCILVICLCFGMAGVGSTESFNEHDKGPAQITLNENGNKPANFNHEFHQETLGSCVFCHDPNLMDIKLMVTDKKYAHTKGCGSCHMKAKGLKKLKCKNCHPRKRQMVEGC